jgi:hypothetical protein
LKRSGTVWIPGEIPGVAPWGERPGRCAYFFDVATMDTAAIGSVEEGVNGGGAETPLNDAWKRLLGAMTAADELETIARTSSALEQLQSIRTRMGTVHAAYEFTDASAGPRSEAARDRARERVKGITVWRMVRSDHSSWQVVIMGEREERVHKGGRMCLAEGGVDRELESDLVDALRACHWNAAASGVLDSLRTGSPVPKAFRGLVAAAPDRRP